jgi:hypothetical protein
MPRNYLHFPHSAAPAVTRESITPLTFYCKIATLPLCFLQSKNKAMLTCSTLSKKSFAIHYL